MSKYRMCLLLAAMAGSWTMATGCVSRDEYLRTEFARRKAAERADSLERDLADERNKAQALEAEREALRRELDTKTAYAETLKGENERLDAFVKKMQGQMDDVLAKGMGKVEVVEVKLPPELDKALKELSAKYPDTIEYDAKKGAVRWKSDLTFAKGSDDVKEEAKASLRAFSDIVNSSAASQFEVVVVGHTDTLPIGPITGRKHPTNWHLSVHRAIAVMFQLKNNGVEYIRMGCMGYGEFRPRVPNPNRGGSEENRRVEIFLVSSKEHVPGMDTTMNSTPHEKIGKAGKTPKTAIAKSDPNTVENETGETNSDDASTP